MKIKLKLYVITCMLPHLFLVYLYNKQNKE
jgi:hypothetical protein